ncbi:thioredoxin family protein [Austwickia chelonae]|uniref:Thioredoxin domain-containing protein n=1 Tax=Austwickia chelonae NBRC 105200 TaxID=1184607 RepID=K6V7R3_9MICO|nr:thioredoxin domain-containing protein [Austwickia chelonae]GAB78268.1 hypothetical protein AUCHE_08_05140 [Austwickia chelonae NBRC 105200]
MNSIARRSVGLVTASVLLLTGVGTGVSNAATTSPFGAEVSAVQGGASIVDVNMSNLEQLKKQSSQRPVFFLITAPAWCGACRTMDPVIRRMAEQAQGKWTLAVIDADRSDAKRAFQVRGYPTIVPYAKGKEGSHLSGFPGEAGLKSFIDKTVSGFGPVDSNPPNKPEEPGRPGRPGQPGQPGRPGQPPSGELPIDDGGQKPVRPGQPGQPGGPGDGQKPVRPGQPGQPGQPGGPGDGQKPVRPGQPGSGQKPVRPGQPPAGDIPIEDGGQKPVKPGQPGGPGDGQKPVKPGQPGGPGDGQKPVKPGQPPADGGQKPVKPVAPGKIVEVTDKNFDQLMAGSKKVPFILDFSKEGCDPCEKLAPVLAEKAKAGNGAFVIGKIDGTKYPKIWERFDKPWFPTLISIIDGKETSRRSGYDGDKAAVNTWIDQAVKGGKVVADPATVNISDEDSWKKVVAISKRHPVALRLHLDNYSQSSKRHGQTAAELAKASGGKWTLANVASNDSAVRKILAKNGVKLPGGLPAMVVIYNGKLQSSVPPLQGPQGKPQMEAWVTKMLSTKYPTK